MFVLSHLIFLSKDFFIQYIIIILARKKKGEEFHSAALAVRIHVKTKKDEKEKQVCTWSVAPTQLETPPFPVYLPEKTADGPCSQHTTFCWLGCQQKFLTSSFLSLSRDIQTNLKIHILLLHQGQTLDRYL
jgi:hypothetical protein